MNDLDTNPRAAIGGNNPPTPTPYEAAKARIDELYMEAKNWIDGEPASTQEQADEIQRLMRMLQEAGAAAEKARKAEVKPLDDAKAEIQARYNVLIGQNKSVTGIVPRTVELCQKALAPFLARQEMKRKIAIEKAAQEAAEKARIAREAMQARQSLEDAERAEQLAQEAKEAEGTAKAIANSKPAARSGEGRAATLREAFDADVVDFQAFARWIWINDLPALQEFLTDYANANARELRHKNPTGVNFTSRQVVR